MFNIVRENTYYSPHKIGYWSDAFPNYDAKLMIVGQDWGTLIYLDKFIKDNGNKIPNPYREKGNPTWENLINFLEEAWFKPFGEYFENIYLTNAVLCLRNWSQMTGSIPMQYFKNCFPFLKEQIDIVKPKIIATLGATVFQVLARNYNIKLRHKTFRDIVANYKKDALITEEGFYIYPLYHTGGLGLRNRKMAKLHVEPVEDFKRLKELFDTV